MAQKSVRCTVPSVTGSPVEWYNLEKLVQASLLSDQKGPISPFGQEVGLRSPSANGLGTIIQVTSDPTATPIAFDEIARGIKLPFTNTGGTHKNTISLMDKWVRGDNGSGAAADLILDVFVSQG